MSLALYMDVHVPYPVTAGLLDRGIDVLTAQWDHTERWPDSELLDRATALARVLVSQDEDLLAEAALRQRTGQEFAGLVFAAQGSLSIGRFIDDLTLLAEVIDSAEMANHVEFLPL
jgi:hypothetical protein